MCSCVFYSKQVLLDDPLSAVDAHVSKYLFDECICGVLKAKTRVLVTHQLQYVSRPEVSHVVVLKDGMIAEQGSYRELYAARGELFRLMKDFAGLHPDASPSVQDNAVLVEVPPATQVIEAQVATVALVPVATVVDTPPKPSDRTSAETTAAPIAGAAIERAAATAGLGGKGGTVKKLMTQEERQTGGVSYGIYYYYLTSIESWVLPFLAITGSILTQGNKVISDWWLSQWTGNTYNRDLIFYLTIYGSFAAVAVIFTSTAMVFISVSAQSAALMLHNNAFSSLMRAPMTFFDTTPIGRIINRFSRDQDVIDNQLGDTIRMTLTTGIQACFTFILISTVTPYFLICCLPIFFLYFRTQNRYRTCNREIKRISAIALSPMYELLQPVICFSSC
jgi:ATP-binding cassette subfamily C (CFTR/MRP) protein 1